MSVQNSELESEFQQVYLKEIGVHTPWSTEVERSDVASIEAAPLEGSSPKADPLPKPHAVDVLSLEVLASEVSSCTRCVLSETRTQAVFGVGNPHADLVFIGEAPGHDEDLKGEPFVERAGALLDRMLTAVDMDRDQVYIMNTVKCHPPNSRDPKVEEVQTCGRWFDAQLKAIAPKMICLLGRVAAQTVLQTDASLSSMRGRWHDYHGIPAWVMYHPAYLLRSPQQKHRAWTDLRLLKQRYQGLV